MWVGILLLLLFGLFFSAFFSGSETGFYRVTRVRLALDARDGDRVSRWLLGLTNHPPLFVATTLVGNNVANYIVSLAIVLGTRQLFRADQPLAELLAPILLSPVLFIYGELLPKHLFFMTPNRLLRLGGPLFILCGLLFSPVAALLWTFGRCLQWLVGEAPEYVRFRLAREELQRIIDEGHELGVLRPAQRQLAQGMFAVANQPVSVSCTPPSRWSLVRRTATRAEVLRVAARHRSSTALVRGETGSEPTGYVRIVEICLTNGDWTEHVRPLMKISQDESHITALLRMQTKRETIARVVDGKGKTRGIVSVRRLTAPMLAR